MRLREWVFIGLVCRSKYNFPKKQSRINTLDDTDDLFFCTDINDVQGQSTSLVHVYVGHS